MTSKSRPAHSLKLVLGLQLGDHVAPVFSSAELLACASYRLEIALGFLSEDDNYNPEAEHLLLDAAALQKAALADSRGESVELVEPKGSAALAMARRQAVVISRASDLLALGKMPGQYSVTREAIADLGLAHDETLAALSPAPAEPDFLAA